jgi:asparagine synthase (glutamine-hydrolysing)
MAKVHVTVVLNGDGGDELFGGYDRPQIERAAMTYRQMLPSSGLRRWLGGRLSGYRRGPLGRLALLAEAGQIPAKRTFSYDTAYARAFRSYRGVAYTPQFQRMLAGWHPDVLYDEVWESAVAEDDVDRVLYSDLVNHFPSQLLAKLDVLTMAHSVEARSPLLDTALIEYSARIPTNLRLRGYTSKYLLNRLAERYLPHEVIYRRKQGFTMPWREWKRGELAPYVKAALQSPVLLERGWLRPRFVRQMLSKQSGPLWTTFVLSVWLHLLEGELSRDDSLEALL